MGVAGYCQALYRRVVGIGRCWILQGNTGTGKHQALHSNGYRRVLLGTVREGCGYWRILDIAG